jgi:hypothetical protein
MIQKKLWKYTFGGVVVVLGRAWLSELPFQNDKSKNKNPDVIKWPIGFLVSGLMSYPVLSRPFWRTRKNSFLRS